MSTPTTNAPSTVRAKRLVASSSLFEAGPLSSVISDHSFILRLNTILASRLTALDVTAPIDLVSAVPSKGKINANAELVAFGCWLLIDGHPGLAKLAGQQPDLRVVLKCVTAAMYELRIRPKLKQHGLPPPERPSQKRSLTKHDLAKRWQKMFAEEKHPSFFDSRIRSATRILLSYQQYIGSGALLVHSKPIKNSPELKKVLDAIGVESKKPKSSFPSAPSGTIAPKPANLTPFDISLRYSSRGQEEIYRDLTANPTQNSSLRYSAKQATSTSPRGALRRDRKDKIVLTPEINLRQDYRVEAVIDRMAILVTTRNPTAFQFLNRQIFSTTAAKVFSLDLRAHNNIREWGAALPSLDGREPFGRHFAVMIQEAWQLSHSSPAASFKTA